MFLDTLLSCYQPPESGSRHFQALLTPPNAEARVAISSRLKRNKYTAWIKATYTLSGHQCRVYDVKNQHMTVSVKVSTTKNKSRGVREPLNYCASEKVL